MTGLVDMLQAVCVQDIPRALADGQLPKSAGEESANILFFWFSLQGEIGQASPGQCQALIVDFGYNFVHGSPAMPYQELQRFVPEEKVPGSDQLAVASWPEDRHLVPVSATSVPFA